jgi:phosphate transport system substrate-binding protein
LTLLWASAWNAVPALGGEPVHCAGAAAPQNLYLEWGRAYEAAGGVRLNCVAAEFTGLAAALGQGTVELGVLDRPLSVTELVATDLVQFPTAIGGVVPIASLPGIVPGALRLNGPALADIFLGRIVSWGDPRLAALNPGLQLPEGEITVVHPTDPSGITLAFTNYLSLQSTDWRARSGAGLTVRWPVGQARRDLQSVASMVQTTPGAIGFVDYGYAADHGLPKVQLQNRAGGFTRPNVVSFQSAAANAPWATTPAFSLMLVDQAGTGTWPLTTLTFAVLPLGPRHPDRALEVLRFLDWAMRKGNSVTDDQGYVPLPPQVVHVIESGWRRQIKRSDGVPIWPESVTAR